MAKTVSKSAADFRERAARHRTLANLLDRRASQEELAENLERYAVTLEEVSEQRTRLDNSIAELEREVFKRVETGGRA